MDEVIDNFTIDGKFRSDKMMAAIFRKFTIFRRILMSIVRIILK